MFGFGGAADECMVSKNQCPEQHIVHICSRNCVFISVMLKLMGFPGKYWGGGGQQPPQPAGSYAYARYEVGSLCSGQPGLAKRQKGPKVCPSTLQRFYTVYSGTSEQGTHFRANRFER